MTDLVPLLLAGSPWAILAAVFLFMLRQVIKDRDWYRDRYEENNRALRLSVEELENRPRPDGPTPLRVVRNGE